MTSPFFNFNKPFPLNESIPGRWRNSAIFSAFVFLFLLIFKPFELSQLPESILLIALGYGLVCFVIMAVLNVAVFSAFPIYFSEGNWSTGREVIWSSINILLIGLGNFLYSNSIGIIHLTWMNLFWFETYTIAVGAFPILATILINQSRLSSKFQTQTDELNHHINQSQEEKVDQKSHPIQISSDSGSDEIELMPEDFLYAKSDDNYVEICFLSHGQNSRKLIRNTLKSVAEMLSAHPNFFRCHKSYIVNLKQVNHISGNAQGYKLHLRETDELLPVSRMHNETIKQYFTDDH